MKNNKTTPFFGEDTEKVTEKDMQFVARGVGYIKSRKADFRVMDMAEGLIRYAQNNQRVLIEDVIVDGTSAVDVDRKSIDELMAKMEQDEIKVVFVRAMKDITDDPLDFIKFMSIAKDLEVSVFDVSKGCVVPLLPLEDFVC